MINVAGFALTIFCFGNGLDSWQRHFKGVFASKQRPGRFVKFEDRIIADILFQAYGETIWREPVRLTVTPDAVTQIPPNTHGQPFSIGEGWYVLMALVIIAVVFLIVLSLLLG